MKWQVELIGKTEDLEELTKIFFSPDLHIIKVNGGFLLESSSFDLLDEYKKVKNRSEVLIEAINATGLLKGDITIPIKRGSIRSEEDSGKKILYMEGKISVATSARAKLTVINKNGIIVEGIQHSCLPGWISLIESDERVKRVYELMNHDFKSWVGLYKILEVIEEDSYPPIMRGGKFEDDIRLFSQTAQSYPAIGKDARHAKLKYIKPKKSMSIDSARALFKKIVSMWLDSKI